MKRYIIGIALHALVMGSAFAKGREPDVKTLLDQEWQYQLQDFPEMATRVGVKGHNDRWTDMSKAAIARRKTHEVEFLKKLQALRKKSLTPQELLFLDIAQQKAQDTVDRQAFGNELLAIDQLEGPQNNIPQLLSLQEASHSADYNDILKRLQGVPAVIDQTLDLLKTGLSQGITPPRITLRDVEAQIAAQIPSDPLKSPILERFNKFPPVIPIEDQKRLQAEAIKIFNADVRPAFVKLQTFVHDEYYPKSRESIGLSQLPQGPAWYAHQIRWHTTTALSAEEIHEIGMNEVRRIRSQMDKIIEQVHFKGSFPDFLNFLKTDPQFYFTNKEEIVVACRDIAKRIDPELPRLIGKLPRLPYGVQPVPSYSEKSQPMAYYRPGSVLAGRPGNFYINTYDVKSQPKWGLEALILHEAVPGHHLQIALAQEIENVPELLKNQRFTAFTEGWALYAESLGSAIGLYQDPYSKFGQLTLEMWRAIRLVVDTGMHAKGWSRQQAIDFFRQNTGKSDHDIEAEIDRYIVWPGQALAYKIGELKIKELRARAEAKQGEKFNARQFHDQILSNGSVPLNVLEAQMIDHYP